MARHWNPHYRSTNGLLAKANKEIGKLFYGIIFLLFFFIGFKIWGASIGLIMGVISDVVYAIV
jgi:hypothetical protein